MEWISILEHQPKLGRQVIGWAVFGLDEEHSAKQCVARKDSYGVLYFESNNRCSVHNLTHFAYFSPPKD